MAVTSNQGEKHEKQCLDVGMHGFYNKPLYFDLIMRAILEHHFRMK